MASLAAAIDVDAEDATKPSSPRIIGGSGDAAAPLELASSSDDDGGSGARRGIIGGSRASASDRWRHRTSSRRAKKKINPFRAMMAGERLPT